MGKSVVWKSTAKAELKAIDQATALRILRALARLITTGEGDVKRLQGIDPEEFRLRVGDYRVLFHNLNGTVEVLSVRHRRDAYRLLS